MPPMRRLAIREGFWDRSAEVKGGSSVSMLHVRRWVRGPMVYIFD